MSFGQARSQSLGVYSNDMNPTERIKKTEGSAARLTDDMKKKSETYVS